MQYETRTGTEYTVHHKSFSNPIKYIDFMSKCSSSTNYHQTLNCYTSTEHSVVSGGSPR